jgi:hypothetical protein
VRRGSARAGLILAAIAVAMLAFGGSADAKKKHKKKIAPVVTATATASGNVTGQTISATATCPAKTNAIGGGFFTPPLPAMPVNTGIATGSHKVGANQWLASMQVIGSPGPPVVLTTTVYCRKGAPATTPVITTKSLPEATSAADLATANASCSAGQVQLSGGFTVDAIIGGMGLANLLLSSNRIDPLTWQATAIAPEPGHTLTSQADCAKKPKKKKGKKGKKKKVKKLVTPTEVTGDVTTSTEAQTVTAVATCPSGMKAVNGGFSQPGALGGSSLSYFFLITESQAVGNTWHVSGFAETTNPGTLRSYGYCSR